MRPARFHRATRPSVLAALLALALAVPARAGDTTPVELSLELANHVFNPAEIHAPKNTPLKITIQNNDSGVEEFDSSALQVEKVILGGHSGVVHLPAMPPGRYPFMGEYHSDTAQGVLIVE
jgi:hypothetical protein